MTNQNDLIRTWDGHTIVIGFFRPEDAEGIVALFRDVYGDAYPVRIYYDPEALVRGNETGDCCSIVARNESGCVVGATHAFRSAPYGGIYESGAGLVLKAYRNYGISKRLQWFLLNRWAPPRSQAAGVFGEAVCNHIHMQKAIYELGVVDMALEAALMPAEAYVAEQSASGRVASVLSFWPVKERPHQIYMPGVYEEALRFLYSGLNDTRVFARAVEPLPAGCETRCKVTRFDFASVARLTIEAIGEDFNERMRAVEQEATDSGVKVIQVWLNLASPWVGAAVDVLRKERYFLGGLLPRWFDDDGLLMQKLFCPPDWEGIRLYTDRAKEILRIIRMDCSHGS